MVFLFYFLGRIGLPGIGLEGLSLRKGMSRGGFFGVGLGFGCGLGVGLGFLGFDITENGFYYLPINSSKVGSLSLTRRWLRLHIPIWLPR